MGIYSKTRKKWHLLSILVAGMILIPWIGRAQVTTGSISGVITDESGAVIAGANVSVANTETGMKRNSLTNAAGRYSFPQLPVGHYEVQAEMTGFQTGVRTGIELTVGRQAVVDIKLAVGAVVEKMVVTGEAPLVESQSATISSLVEGKTVSDLPLNGRSFDQLIALTPGAFNFTSKGAPAISGLGNVYSVAGARYHSNKFLIDGTEMIGGGSLTSNPSSVSGENLGVESLAEFRVLTNNYGAEYGKRAGGTISVITKSGTNNFHGSVFAFHRNDNLDARDFFSTSKPEFKRNNFGASAGGPILSNRLFVFGTYEGLRERLGQTLVAIVPDANARRGLVPDPATGGLRSVGVDPRVRPYLESYGEPNGVSFGDGTAQSINNASRPTREDFFTTRSDFQAGPSDTWSGIYRFDDAVRTDFSSGLNPNFNAPQNSRHQMITIQETHIFSPSVLNVFRAGFGRWAGFLDGGAPANERTANLPPFASFYERVGDWNVGGAASTIARTLDSLTGAVSPARIIVNNSFEWEDQLSLTRGGHGMKTGVQVQRLQKNIDGPSTRFGRYSFPSLEAMLQGRPNLFTGPTADSISMRGFRQTLFTAYFQDDWAVTPKLTLNLGLRYETLTSPFEVNGKISNWADTSVNGLRVILTEPTLANPPYANHSKTGFAPRFGLAWRPFGGGGTVLRGGGGIFYDQLVDWFGFFLTNNPPFKTASIPNPTFPEPFSTPASSSILQIRGSTFDMDVPTRFQYNLQVQRELSSAMVLSVGYVGSTNYHLTRSVNSNIAFPQFLPDGRKFFAAGLPRRNPQLGTTGRYILTDANGHYDSLQVEFRSRLRGGLRFQTSYSWSKSLDDASEILPAEAGGQPGSSQDPDDRADRGLSLFDLRHSFNANFNYDLPLGKNRSGWAGKSLAGWQVNGIVTVHSGTPLTPLAGINISRNLDANVPDRPNLAPGASTNPVRGGPEQYFDPTAFVLPPAGFYGNLARNTVIGPGFATVDFSLFKNTSFKEGMNLQFRVETFNLFNRVNFGIPRNTLFANTSGARVGAAGRIDTTLTSARQIQFGMKLIW